MIEFMALVVGRFVDRTCPPFICLFSQSGTLESIPMTTCSIPYAMPAIRLLHGATNTTNTAPIPAWVD